MNKSFCLLLSVICCLLFVGCKNPLFDSTFFRSTKIVEQNSSQLETDNTSDIDKDLQGVYARNWNDEFAEKRTTNLISQVTFGQPQQQPQRQPRQLNSQLTVSELLNRGESAKRSGHSAKATSYYHAILKKEPKHPMAHHQLAVLADKKQDFRTSEYHYLTALRSKRNDPDLYSDLGYSYLMQNNLQAAESYFLKALQLRPSHQLALNNLGILYGRAGDYSHALEMFRRTGTEQEAKQKLASLMPPGNSQPNDKKRLMANRHLENQEEYQQEQQQPEPVTPSQYQTTQQNESIQNLRQRMKQIRREAVAKRNGHSPEKKQSDKKTPAMLNSSRRTIPLIPDNYPQEKQTPVVRQPIHPSLQPYNQQPNHHPYQNDIDPQLQQQMKTGRLPDNRLNDVFRAIEQSDYNRASRQRDSYAAPSPRNRFQQPPRQLPITHFSKKSPENLNHRGAHPLFAPQERKRQDVNPLDSMPAWEPPRLKQTSRINDNHSGSKSNKVQGKSRYQQSSRYSNSRLTNLQGAAYLPKEYRSMPEDSQSTGQNNSMQSTFGTNQNQFSKTYKQAAQIGMSGGMGSMLPTINDRQRTATPASYRSFPGSQSRIGGSEFAPQQSFINRSPEKNVQHSHHQQTEDGDIDAIQMRSALYWKNPNQIDKNNGVRITTHQQQYQMRQSQYRNQQLSQERNGVNNQYNRNSQHLSHQPIPQGNGYYSPQAGQYYTPSQYKKETSNSNNQSANW